MRVRVAASAALATLVAIAVAGCGLVTPQATLKRYDPSDGVGAHIGDVRVLNVLVIVGDTRRTADDANLVMTVVNSSEKTVRLRVQFRSDGERRNRTVVAAPGSTEVGYGDAGQFLLSGFHPETGALAPIYVQYGTHQGAQLRVPVLDDSWSSYSDLGPTPRPESTNPPVTPYPVASPEGDGG